jgi:endonuclease-8
MPEGDSLRRAAARLRVLEGEVVSAESPHPRAAALGIAARIDGRRLERVEAVGKNLLLTFDGNVVVRSHLRMRGRWQVRPAGAGGAGLPWLVLRGSTQEAVLWHGPVLELGRAAIGRLGPDILADPPDYDGMVARLRQRWRDGSIGEALLDQRSVAGIGNLWRAEALFAARVSPWTPVRALDDGELRDVLAGAARLMHAGRAPRAVYRRAGLPCRACGTLVEARRQGEDARTAYWCPACQAGSAGAKA